MCNKAVKFKTERGEEVILLVSEIKEVFHSVHLYRPSIISTGIRNYDVDRDEANRVAKEMMKGA